MARNRIPKHCRHKAWRLGYVTLDGRQVYTGPWPDTDKPPPDKTQAEYDRLIAEWLLRRSGPPQTVARPEDGVSVNELLLAYLRHAEAYYVKNGKPTDQIKRVKRALRGGARLHGDQPAAQFGPLALQAVRDAWVKEGLSRNYVNSLVASLCRAWKWGASVQMVPASCFVALKTVEGLKKGRTSARETEDVRPVAWEDVEKTLAKLGSVVADMVRVQFLAGMRPAEATLMKPASINQDGEDPDGKRHAGVWVYTPETHKTEHRGCQRVIFLGPKAQAILKPYMDRDPDAYLFSAREASETWRAKLRVLRKTRVQPSQQHRRKPNPKRAPRGKYDRRSYYVAVQRACERAGVEGWSPNRLRHSRATEIRRLYGKEHARAVLGHTAPGVTEIYAERDLELASLVMREIG